MNRLTELKIKVLRPAIYAILVVALLFSASCKMPQALQDLVEAAEKETGITLSFGMKSGRTIQPAIEMTPASYDISGTGPSGKTFTRTSSVSPVEITGLSTGSWTVSVIAKNRTNQAVGHGTGATTTLPGGKVNLNITVSPYEGTGNLNLNLVWPADKTSTPSVQATLMPTASSAIPLTFTLATGQASVSTAVEAGYYTLALNLYDGSTLVMGVVEVVRIVKDQTTSGTFNFSDLNAVNGGYQINISPELSDPLPVAITGGQASIAVGSGMTLTATSGPDSANNTYIWYLNGATAGTGPSYTYTAQTAGSYRIAVSAFSADGLRGGSADFSFTVTAPVVVEPPVAANTASSITQYGVTWTFDKAYPVGQFVTGDWWVQGPVRIVSISPLSVVRASDGRTINGSMLNPAVNTSQGYDSAMFGAGYNAHFVAGLNAGRPNGADLSAQNPLIINTPASLISGVSYADLPAGVANRVRLLAVLTILDAIPPADAFRPPYVGTDKHIRHTLSEVNRSRMTALAPPANTLDVTAVAARFEKPWVEHMGEWLKELFCAPDNQDNYGREIASDVSDAALLLTLNVNAAGKELLMKRMIQLGLDYYGIIREPNGRINYKADGGHMPGRVFPILFAGLMFNDQEIMSMMQKSGQYAYQNGYYEGRVPPDYIHFGEVDQTFYVTQRDVDRTNGLLGTWSPDPRSPAVPYLASDIGLVDWGITHVHWPQGDNKEWTAIYRSVNSEAWSGYVLASRILGIRDAWNHPPLFDYVDRWMSTGSGNADNAFQKTMWTTYRPAY